jgi:transposase InsO family protein
MIANHHRAPFPTSSEFCANEALELLHGELCGPISPATFGGKKYFLLVVDDCTCYMWAVLIRSKDEALAALKKIKNSTETELRLKVMAIRTDRGGEFTSKVFSSFCDEVGIRHFLMAPYSPQQNGVVERRNQTVVGMAQSLLRKFWGEAVATSVFLLNRAPTKAVNDKTPYETLYGVKPDVHYLNIFRCLGYVKKVGVHQPKLADRSSVMIFIGYEPNSKAYYYKL